MHLAEFQRRQRSLDEQLAAGIELLRAAHRAQSRALELVWTASPENAGPAQLASLIPDEAAGTSSTSSGDEAAGTSSGPPPAASTAERGRRWGIGELEDRILDLLEDLPEAFDRGDVIAALGETPDRSSLYKVLERLRFSGVLEFARHGGGRVTSRYRRRAEEAESPPVE
jgi:hypothetical protein